MPENSDEDLAALLNQIMSGEHEYDLGKQSEAVVEAIKDNPVMLIRLIGGEKQVKDLILRRLQESTPAPGVL